MVLTNSHISIRSLKQYDGTKQRIHTKNKIYKARKNWIKNNHLGENTDPTKFTFWLDVWSHQENIIQEELPAERIIEVISDHGWPKQAAEKMILVGKEVGLLTDTANEQAHNHTINQGKHQIDINLENPENPSQEIDIERFNKHGSSTIKMADPEEHPSLYLSEPYISEFCHYDIWIDIFQIDYEGYLGAISFADLVGNLDAVTPVTSVAEDLSQSVSQLDRVAICSAALGIGKQAGVVQTKQKDGKTYITFSCDPVLFLLNGWKEKANFNEGLSKADIKSVFYKVYNDRNNESYFHEARMKGVIYPKKNNEDEFLLNIPSTDNGIEYKLHDLRNVGTLLTYSADIQNGTDVDANALHQFLDEFVETESDNDMVPVSDFTVAFDRWAKLNAVPLDELAFDRAKNMRKGKMRNILQSDTVIEKTRRRIDGERTRVYQPMRLDDRVRQLINS